MQRALAAREQAALNETLDPCVADDKDEWRQIYVRFVRDGYPTVCFSIQKDVPMQKLMEIYCMRQGLDASATNFSASEPNFSASETNFSASATNLSEKLKPLETFEEAGLGNGCALYVLT